MGVVEVDERDAVEKAASISSPWPSSSWIVAVGMEEEVVEDDVVGVARINLSTRVCKSLRFLTSLMVTPL